MKKLNLLKSLGIASMFLFALVLAAPNYGYAADLATDVGCGVLNSRTQCNTTTHTCIGETQAEAGKCKLNGAQTCTTGDQCVSGTCANGKCTGGSGGNSGVPLKKDNLTTGVLVSTELNQTQDLVGTISTVINWFLGFVGIIVFGIFLLAGFEYATAGGDAGKTETAQKRMTNAVIGMVILFFAFTASNTILTFVFGSAETKPF